MRGNLARRDGRIGRQQRSRNGAKHDILNIGIRRLVFTFEFDADREIVTTRPAVKTGFARMPGPASEWHELHEFAVAANQKMR